METHVSSTSADVPETQEVVGSHGNVELVIVVEKLDEEQPQKADSNAQGNVQPAVLENKSIVNQSKKDNITPKSPPKQESVSKEVGLGKPIQPLIKIQRPKQSNLQMSSISGLQSMSKLSEKEDIKIVQNTSPYEQVAHIDADSTSLKSSSPKMSDEISKEKDCISTPEREASNDSQTEINSDVSEKEQNKSISRELKSLINSAKESKIISECTKVTTKTRKSKAALDTSNTNLNNVTEAESIRGTRRSSSNSQQSNGSEKSGKVGKRSMRSQNPEFVNKVKQFLNSVTGKFQRGGDSDVSLSASDEEMPDKSKENTTDNSIHTPKSRDLNLEQNTSGTTATTKLEEKNNKLRSDPYCWRCHWSIDMTDGEKAPQPPLRCTVCPRAFHYRCLTGTERTKITSEKNWVCPECMTVLHAESSETRSPAMKKITLGMLCELLKFALQRMTEVNGVEPFMQPVDRSVFPDYDKYVVHPMDLALMREHISEGLYGSTEAFLADVHWILHNSIIFNTMQSKLTAAARALVRSCRVEMGEIEACPECYAAAHARRATWFTDVCSTPHLLLWAKLKGFPYWPAKAMSVSHAGLVDVRFFGAHDRAWVPARDCFLYSQKDPNNFRTKRQDIIESMQEAVKIMWTCPQEAEQHIRNISRKYGKFVYAPFRLQFEPAKFEDQLKLMIPSFEGSLKNPLRERRSRTPALVKKCRSSSKGSKDDVNAGDDGSDREESPMKISKMDDETEKLSENSPLDKSSVVTSRKRRPSDATGSPPSCSKPKRKRTLSSSKEQELKKIEPRLVTSSKEISQEIEELDEEMLEEPTQSLDDVECQSSTSATPNKSFPVQNVNRDTPRTTLRENMEESICQPNKITSKNDFKSSETEKKTVPETKTLPQAVRISRSAKNQNNGPSMEVEQSSADSSSPNSLDKTAASNVQNKPLSSTNKNVIKTSADTTIKTNTQKVVSNQSASIAHDEKKVDKTVPPKLNKNVDTVTSNKKIENEKTVKNKSNEFEKVTQSAIIRNNDKETVLETAKARNKEITEPSNELHENSKKKNRTVPSNVVSSNNDAKNNKTTDIDSTNKSSDNNSASKEVATEKNVTYTDKSATSKSSFVPKPGCSKVTKSVKEPVKPPEDANTGSKVNKTVTTAAFSSGLPTIISVRSLSSAPAAAPTPTASPASAPASATAPAASPAPATSPAPASKSSNTVKAKTAPVTVEVNPDSSIFTPTSTDNVRNMKEAVNKLQKLRTGFDQPPVGRVGVRAFARMTSPPEKLAKTNDVLVEIKSEPVEFEEPETPQEPPVLDFLRPRPVPPVIAPATLREVRISKVVPGPDAVKKAMKPPDARPRAKKTFPQPKKADDGRSELTNKNSMVYIPIQPPMSQAPVPVRATFKAAAAGAMAAPRTPPLNPTSVNVAITSIAPTLLPMAPPPPPAPLSSSAGAAPAPSVLAPAGVAGALLGAAVPSVPTTVHTVPLITSVNGQWTFSLQPVMSVGGVDSIPSPMVNGVSERMTAAAPTGAAPGLVPGAGGAAPALAPGPAGPVPAPGPAQALAPARPAALAPASPPAPPVATRPSETALGEPPRLTQRPVLQSPLAASTPVGDVPAPSAAGPLTAKLNQNSVKLADFFRTLLEDSLEQLEEPAAAAAALRLQLEQARWRHQHELTELRHTHELLLVEVRAAMEKEKARAVAEARRLAHAELEAAVKHAKSKQWCANCSQEAQFYCCWNTSYCDYPCQRAHWAHHYSSCTQQRAPDAGSSKDSRARPAEPAPPAAAAEAAATPKTTSAPTLTVGGKLTTRIVNLEQAQKSSVVVGAPEDASGHPAAKSAAPPASQLISSDEGGGKRLVSSGGYLIVGPAARRAPAPARLD